MSGITRYAGALRRTLRGGWNAILTFIEWIELVDQVRLEREMLAQMSDRHLRDIGIDQATAKHESARSAIDLPGWRLRQKLGQDQTGVAK